MSDMPPHDEMRSTKVLISPEDCSHKSMRAFETDEHLRDRCVLIYIGASASRPVTGHEGRGFGETLAPEIMTMWELIVPLSPWAPSLSTISRWNADARNR